jgi:hypothetical protein
VFKGEYLINFKAKVYEIFWGKYDLRQFEKLIFIMMLLFFIKNRGGRILHFFSKKLTIFANYERRERQKRRFDEAFAPSLPFGGNE